MDESTRRITFINNTAIGCSRRGFSVHISQDHIIDGNTLLDIGSYAIDFNFELTEPFPLRNNTLRNNIFLSESVDTM